MYVCAINRKVNSYRYTLSLVHMITSLREFLPPITKMWPCGQFAILSNFIEI